MKSILFVIGLFCTTIGYSQETHTVFESQEYKELRKYYENSLSSNQHTEHFDLEKEFIEKLGVDNFRTIENSSVLIEDWLKENWTKTSFSSLEEANELLKRKSELTKQISDSSKEILPLFEKLVKEIGHDELFKKLNEDLRQDLLNKI